MPYEKTIKIVIHIPDGHAANVPISAKLVDDPAKGEQDALVVPVVENWVIDDIFVTSAPSIDCILKIEKGFGRYEKVRTPPLSALRIDQPGRAEIPAIWYKPGEALTVTAIPLAANTTGAEVVVEAYAKVKVYNVEEEALIYEEYAVQG